MRRISAAMTVSAGVVALLLVAASPSLAQLPDTGQLQSYTDTFGEDSDYAIHPRSFTKLGDGGSELPDTASLADGWLMTRDDVTGLIWEIKRNKDGTAVYGDLHDADNTYTWCDTDSATNGGNAGTCGKGTDSKEFLDTLNQERFGGFDDWRLPTIKELSMIVDCDRRTPSIDTAYFPNTQSSRYWSADSDAMSGDSAWVVSFYDGEVAANGKFSYGDTHFVHLRAVRGPKLQSGDYVDNNDGTVTDSATGLMWAQNHASKKYAWDAAIQYCEKLTLAGYDDWRLPNRNELQSIVDYSEKPPAIDRLYFPKIYGSKQFHTSTTRALDADQAWLVYIESGALFSLEKLTPLYVLAVRSLSSQPLTTWYLDADGDGWGDPGKSYASAAPPAGYVSSSSDCNDADAGIHPGAVETCGDGIDQDCDGSDAECQHAADGGYELTAALWARAVLEVPGAPVTLVWKMVGADFTPSGDQVISGYFYADPNDFAYGSVYNPELFVKIYVAVNGWCNIAFNHVTVDPVSVYSAFDHAGSPTQTGSATLADRLVEHQYDGVPIDTALQSAGESPALSGSQGYTLDAGLWIRAVLQAAGNPVNLIWKAVGTDTTPSGDRVVSGYFYASPADFAYGSVYNPEVFVKIYIAANGWANLAFNHVTVDSVDIFSASGDGATAQSGQVTLRDRLAEHSYSGVGLAPQ